MVVELAATYWRCAKRFYVKMRIRRPRDAAGPSANIGHVLVGLPTFAGVMH